MKECVSVFPFVRSTRKEFVSILEFTVSFISVWASWTKHIEIKTRQMIQLIFLKTEMKRKRKKQLSRAFRRTESYRRIEFDVRLLIIAYCAFFDCADRRRCLPRQIWSKWEKKLLVRRIIYDFKDMKKSNQSQICSVYQRIVWRRLSLLR